MTTAHHSRTSSATADLDQDSQSSAADVASDAARQEEVRADLEAAVTQANSAIEAGIAVGDDVLQMVVDELDAAIQQAVEASISAKYSKKVRKRLHLLLQEAVTAAAGGDDDGATAFPAAAYDTPAPKQEWQTAGPRMHKPTSSRAESPAMAPSSSRVGSQSPQQQRRHQRQASGQTQAQGQFVHALLPPEAQYVGMGGPPPPPPPPRQPPPPPPSQPSPRPSSAEVPSGRSRNRSGNAWGVPANQCFNPQVRFLLLLTPVEFSVTHEPISPFGLSSSVAQWYRWASRCKSVSVHFLASGLSMITHSTNCLAQPKTTTGYPWPLLHNLVIMFTCIHL